LRKDQALALLQLIADLYVIANAPDPEPAPEPVPNGREPVPVKT
jgi:hypothetical protein